MYINKVKELKEQIKDCLNSKGFRFKINIINGNDGIMRMVIFDGKREQVIETLEKNFKDLEINKGKDKIYTDVRYINIKTLMKKEGIDLEIEKLELKLKELKEQRRKEQEIIKREEKIKELKGQLKELE